MTKDGDGRNLPDQPYPIVLVQRAFHRLRHRRRSSRRRLVHRPIIFGVSSTVFLFSCIPIPPRFTNRQGLRRLLIGAAPCGKLGGGLGVHTSGKVPLEKTLKKRWSALMVTSAHLVRQHLGSLGLHQQTGLSASTVSNDDELPSNLRHDG
jgi:hypothetical protein